MRTAAVLGAACLILAPVAPRAGAQTDAIPVYEATGVGSAINLKFAFDPSIFDPLLDVGLLYATSGINSQGDGQSAALAATAFPGSLVVGGAGCSAVPGSPWVQAYHPRVEGCKVREEFIGNRTSRSDDPVLSQALDRLAVEQVRLLADTAFGRSDAVVEFHDVAFAADPNAAPVAAIETLVIRSEALLGEQVGHRVSVTAKGVDLLGMFHIDTVRSVAQTSSDAVAGAASGGLTIVGATTSIGNTPRAITIDEDGIRVTDPDLSHRQRIGLQEKVDETLLAAGLEIVAASPVEIEDGTRAETTVGGLVIAVKGAVPTVSIPREAAQVMGEVIQQIPTQCLGDFGAPLPVCFGAGALPGPGTAVKMSLNIASATSSTVGERPTFIDPGDPIDPGDGGFGPGIEPFDPGTPPVFDPGPQTPVDPGGPAPGVTTPRAPLVGLVARLPAAGLLWGGVGLLLLALGAAFGPSLRHARAH